MDFDFTIGFGSLATMNEFGAKEQIHFGHSMRYFGSAKDYDYLS